MNMMLLKYLTQNRTYTSKQTISPQWVIVHSVGTAGKPTIQKLWDSWNTASASKSVHGMVDDTGWALTLPPNVKGWHVGSKGNGISVGFEICEPKTIVYADAAHTKVDTAKYNPQDTQVRADFLKRYQNAVEAAAYFCKTCAIAPDHVLCHQEAAKKGIATNHADVLHWFPLFGKTMDGFRADVRNYLNGNKTEIAKPKEETVPFLARITADTDIYSDASEESALRGMVKRGDTYTILEVRNGFGRLKSGAGWILLRTTERRELK